MPPFKRPTMRAIAEKANVSAMTVSLALRNHPSIPETTKSRIQEIAQKLNYRPDPVLHAFHSYRRSSQSNHYQGTLAWLETLSLDDAHRQSPAFTAFFEGAKEKAQTLGYQLEKFELSTASMTGKRMTDILCARNISGLLLPPQSRPQSKLDLDWSNFSVVTFGYTLASPRFHSVCHNHFQSMLTTIAKLRASGCRKIGFSISEETNNRVGKLWLAAYLTEQQESAKKDRIEPLLIKGMPSAEKLKKWLNRYQPEAVIAIDPKIPEILQSLGIQIPEDIKFALCGDALNNQRFAHINENSFVIGSTAANLLANRLQHNDRGIPTNPQRILIEGYWVDGRSCHSDTD